MNPAEPNAPLGSREAAGIDTVDLSGTPGWRMFGLSNAWVLAAMPDGMWSEGIGPTIEEATADARRKWLRWKRGHSAPLAVDGRDYQRRLRARRRRKAGAR